MKTPIALALIVATTAGAAAEGERSPMIGGALTYANAPDHGAELVGGELELALWSRWFGLAVEAAVQRSVANDDVRNLAIAGSARVLVATWLSGSLFEPRDVETGIELHAVATRTWWSRDDRSDAFGLGAAIRMRGSSDADPPSLIAESRLFVRVMKSRDDVPDIAVRSAGPVTVQPERRGLAVIVGLGAAFGTGKQRYLERFRLRDRELLR